MLRGLRNLWPLCLVILGFSLIEARYYPQKPYAIVVGSVLCYTCIQDVVPKGSHYISGATVAVECLGGASRPTFYQETKTDRSGKFKVQLPFSSSRYVKKIEGCTAKLVKGSQLNCTATATSSVIHEPGSIDFYSAVFLTFNPLKQQGLCDKQLSVTNLQPQSLQDLLQLISLIPNPNAPFQQNMPSIPQLPPLPELPKLPPLPVLPFPVTPVAPFKDEVESDLKKHLQQLFLPIVPPLFTSLEVPVPDPYQTLPLVPSPFNPLTQATPSPVIPNPLQPPSPPASILPPVPSLTPPTSSPPTPAPTFTELIPPAISMPPTP